MKFIDIECTAHLDGVAAGVAALKSFINDYRYTDGSYQAGNATTMDEFIKELLIQKRIEFGEKVLFTLIINALLSRSDAKIILIMSLMRKSIPRLVMFVHGSITSYWSMKHITMWHVSRTQIRLEVLQ